MDNDSLFDTYRPQPEWYLHHAGGIHGFGHAARVLVWADSIAAWLEARGTAVEREAVRWAAALHDVRRVNDGTDLAHGERCGTWLRWHHAELGLPLSDAQLKVVRYAIEWHVPEDGDAPQLTAELMCLKDADGLDRVRIADLDTDYLRTAYAETLATHAQKLYDLSQRHARQHDQWNAVKAAASELGVWR